MVDDTTAALNQPPEAPVSPQGELSEPRATTTPPEAPKAVWERLLDESEKAFAAFEIYLHLGLQRSIDASWRIYSERVIGRNEDQPKTKTAWKYYRAWAKRYKWIERSRAWDDDQAEASRDRERDRLLEERARDLEEDIQQRRLRRRHRHSATGVVYAYFRDLLQGVDAQELTRMSFSDKLFHAPRLNAVMTGVLRQERSEGDMLREREGGGEQHLRIAIDQIVNILKRFVPQSQWDAVADELESLDGEAGL